MAIIHSGLRQLAARAGAEGELDTTNFEVFAHGTTTTSAKRIFNSGGGELTAAGGRFGGKFYTVMDLKSARIFADRSCAKVLGEKPLVVAFALPADILSRMKNLRTCQMQLISGPPIGVPASTTEYVFTPGAFPDIVASAFFFLITENE